MKDQGLHRGLQNRHIQLIALGGAVGTGLFLGSAPTIAMTGPSIILGYLIGGCIAFLLMRQLGEMVAEEPVAGSFSYFSHKYWGDYPGFLSGWNYWILYILIGITELTASAAYMTHWFPNIPTFAWTLIFFIIINAINMLTVKAYGEMEFWFALIKIIAIILMMIFGIYLLFFTNSVPGATVNNLWSSPVTGEFAGNPAKGGFFPFGVSGLVIALPIIVFSFGGLELLGITAAEADNPQKVIPKAVNQVVYRILIFYVGTFLVLLSLYHWSYLGEDKSPFVMIFQGIGFNNVAGLLNFIVLTAALSVYNSCVYSNSRMLYGLALQGNAHPCFAKTNKRGVPMNAIILASSLTFLVVPLNLFVPQWQVAFKMALSVVVAACLINWFTITMAHLKFRAKMNKDGHKTIFPALFYPLGNYIVIAFIIFMLVVMWTKLNMSEALIAGVIWVAITYVWFLAARKNDQS